jgi:S1-C subfamily serine protease
MTGMKRFFIAAAGDQSPARGPFSLDEIHRAMQNGELSPDAMICEEGSLSWQPILQQVAPRPSTPSFVPPLSSASAPPHAMSSPPRRPTSMPLLLVAGGLLLGLTVLVVILGVVVARRVAGRGTPEAVVRVVLKAGSGTGFFVVGPDEQAYVATAYHVVASGEPILIERTLDGPGHKPYVEAYPETEVVAFDADADLAIVRLNNVRRDHFPSLTLAREPVADETILSYGFPASNLAQSFGMVSKPGKVLSLVRFPVFDRRSGEIVRNDAIDGLLVSSEIEPGFSGGPTCNERGEVVGVNLTKDTVHRAQNGAVSVLALRALLAGVKAGKDSADPTPADVKALLTRIEQEYLLLPIDRRKSAREGDFISSNDLPRVEQLITTVRKLENETARDASSKLSGQAMLGIVLARLPGRPLETYMDHSTRKALADCEVHERGLQDFFGALGNTHGRGDPTSAAEVARAKCSELAFRPIVWDLTALALQWEGKERDISVTKVESVDPARHVYRAEVHFSTIDHLVDVWLGGDGGRLRLKLFNNDGQASGLSVARSVDPSALQGTWRRSEPRTARTIAKGLDADEDMDETLVLAADPDRTVNVSHQVRRHIYMTGARRLACGGTKLDLGLEQSFTGQLQDGSVVAFRQKDAKPLGSDMTRCSAAFTYAPDQVAVLKAVGDKLLMYRTDGVAYPEMAEFAR